jgi:hypothetical protein
VAPRAAAVTVSFRTALVVPVATRMVLFRIITLFRVIALLRVIAIIRIIALFRIIVL